MSSFFSKYDLERKFLTWDELVPILFSKLLDQCLPIISTYSKISSIFCECNHSLEFCITFTLSSIVVTSEFTNSPLEISNLVNCITTSFDICLFCPFFKLKVFSLSTTGTIINTYDFSNIIR